MRVELVVKGCIVLVTMSLCWANMLGLMKTQEVELVPWGVSVPMPGVYMTCTATYWSGARIGMMRATILVHLRVIPVVLTEVNTELFAAVLGAAVPGSFVLPAATGAPLTAGTAL